ncbi:hypothetical protein FB45DRAFT_1062665 [Roridomyces roridus]|uniref:DNA 3'-5' helicase n=1 Tax=Roridomyces roridus TaxID=1738132 RepID=A0AAD7FF88_9AGAR|nr:hypothetical protein FB45DRAFT_1062665 [Roridomyces roridus]
MPAGCRWRDPQGQDTITQIVRKLIPQWPNGLYPAQLQLVTRVLEGEDFICCMHTGGGKSALFSVPIIVLREVLEMEKLDVPALSYCHETVTEARRNLVQQIAECKTWNVVFVDPEHFRDKSWRQISASPTYRTKILYSCTDEAHLMDDWGISFRPGFKHIGPMNRGRLPSSISVFGLSATLQPGPATRSVITGLGMLAADCYEYRESNERPNTQFIMQPLENGVGGSIFP